MRKAYTPEQIEICDNRIRRTCHPKQRAFVFDTARRVSCIVGRGGGKTIGELLRIVRRMVGRIDQNCLFIAATRESAERLVWRDLKNLISDGLRLQGAKFNESDLTMILPNGSRLLLFGCDDKSDIQKLRGITYHEVGIDEVASIKPELLRELLTEVIGPRMIGAISLIGTPGKRLEGLFYDATRPGSSDHRAWADRDLPEYANWDKWSSHAWNIKDGVDAGIPAMAEIYTEQLLNKARESWSDSNPYWLREYMGQWAGDASTNVYVYRPYLDDGKEWNQWSPERDAEGFAKLPGDRDDWGYGIGIDVGYKDAFAIEVFAFSYTDPSRTLYQVYEIYRTRLYANAIAKILIGEQLNHDRYGGIIAHIGWPAAMVGDFAGAGGALLEELATVYGITVKAADKPYRYKDNAIELMNSDLFDGRIKIMKGSKLADEMLGLQWVVDAYGKRTENKAQPNHACDAAMYIRNAVAGLLPSAGNEPAPIVPPIKRPAEDDDIPKPKKTYGDADAMYRPEDLYLNDEGW